MATKRQRGASWHYVIRRKGLLPKPVYLSFSDEAEGDKTVAKIEALLDKGIVPDELARPADVPVMVADLIDQYLCRYKVSADDRAILGAWRTALRVKASAVDFAWAESLVGDLKARKLAPGTIRHRIGALARCLDWAVRRGDVTLNPLRMLPRGYSVYQDGAREDVSRDRRLEPGEEAAIRRVLAGGYVPDGKQRALTLEHRESLVLLFDLALETAMRLREIYTLERSQVDLERRTAFLDKTKNGDKRQVPLSTVAVAALERYLAAHPRDEREMLLPFFDGHWNRTTSRLSRIWDRVFDHAGCPDLHFHDLRHESVCRLFERTTLSDVRISLITGHRDLRMLKRYANLRGSDIASELW